MRHTVSIQFIRNNISFDNEKMGECMHYLSVYRDRDKVTIECNLSNIYKFPLFPVYNFSVRYKRHL